MGNNSKIVAYNFITHDPITMYIPKEKNPLVELIKHKDHVFLHGGMIDFHNTFVPVVNFSNGSLIIMMAEISGWE